LGGHKRRGCDCSRAAHLPEPDAEPRGLMVQAEWHALPEDAVRTGRGANWRAFIYRGTEDSPTFYITLPLVLRTAPS
jgi:hypothetical protein